MSAANVISISNVSNIPDNERGPLLKESFAAHCSGRSVLTTLSQRLFIAEMFCVSSLPELDASGYPAKLNASS